MTSNMANFSYREVCEITKLLEKYLLSIYQINISDNYTLCMYLQETVKLMCQEQ